MAPLTFPDGAPIRDRQVEDAVLKEAHARWLLARQAAEEAAQKTLDAASQVTVEQVCLAYLADARVNGAEQTYEVRADTLFDFCFGLPARFRSKDATPKPLTKEMREEAAKARIHKGYGRLPLKELVPLHVDQWLNAHKDWKGCRRTRIQAVKRAINYSVEKGLVPKNPIRGYKTPKANSRVTYITAEQEEALLKNANRALRIAIKVCIRTGARYYSEFCKLTRRHVKDYGDRMEWVFQPNESKTGKLRTIRIMDPEILAIIREEMKRHSGGPIFRGLNGKPWTRNNLCRRFVELRHRLERKKMEFDSDCCMYSCRHTYAKRTLQGYWTGKPCAIETLARLMGNSVQVCRDHYLQWSESYNEPLWEAC